MNYNNSLKRFYNDLVSKSARYHKIKDFRISSRTEKNILINTNHYF